ncbi:MAG: diaminopimelate epimerase [Clostridia bacterium]|nr:diaminopimelate epimerase [Clostridia bacterium]
MKFVKMHAVGNDYAYFDFEKVKNYDLSLLSKIVSDRRFGIGSDGLIAVEKLRENKFKMIMYNADGSRGATCGNGVRCSAYFAKKYLGATGNEIKVKTDAFDTTVFLSEKMGKIFAKADMGVIKRVSNSQKITNALQKVGLYVDYRQVFEINAGNKHLVFFYPNHSLVSLAKGVNKSRLYLDGVNIERVYKIERTNLSVRIFAEIFERGTGKTLSCGSGACAIYKAFREFSVLSPQKAEIITDGGTLFTEIVGEKTYLQSEICEVFKGELNEDLILGAKNEV